MSYSVSMLATIAECDSLLTLAHRDKNDLDFRKTSITRQKDNLSETGVEVDQDLTTVKAEIAAFQTMVATLPDGLNKEDATRKLKKAELKLMALTKKDRNTGTVSLLTLELDIARAQKEMDELDAFIAEVTTKKATL